MVAVNNNNINKNNFDANINLSVSIQAVNSSVTTNVNNLKQEKYNPGMDYKGNADQNSSNQYLNKYKQIFKMQEDGGSKVTTGKLIINNSSFDNSTSPRLPEEQATLIRVLVE